MNWEELMWGQREIFAEEAEELVRGVTRDLLQLDTADASGRSKLREQVARCLHTLKGSAATVSLDDASELAHALEDWLRAMDDRGASESLHVVLAALDSFLVHVHGSTRPGETPPSLAPTLQSIVALTGGNTPTPDPVEEAPPPGPLPRRTGRGGVREQGSELPTPSPGPPGEGAGGWGPTLQPDTNQQRDLETVLEAREVWRVTPQDVTALIRHVEQLRELRLRLEDRRATLAGVVEALAPTRGAGSLHARLSQLTSSLEADASEFAEVVAGAEGVVKAVGTVPVEKLAEPLARAAREVARSLNKRVRLSVTGGGAVERRVVESLRGALVHLVRNAVAHGIEAPEERERKGKHREGAVVVRFEHPGHSLAVSVEDDGAGINLARVRKAAQVLGRAQVDTLTDAAALDLVFEPGLSTAESLTSVAGRGVGLDAVRNQVIGLGGRIEVRTVPSQGTRFTATIPVDIGASALVIVRVGEQHIGLPVASVANLTRAVPGELHDVRGRTHLLVRGALQPLERLSAVLGLQSPGAPVAGQPLVHLQIDDRSLVVAVDEIIGDEELVIRPLPQQLQSLAAYTGAATLADGRLLMVLRPEWIAEQVGSLGRAPVRERVLVVDDSLTARALHRTVLESAGFLVHCLGSATQALDQLAVTSYDALVCDIGMEGIDGVELTARLRASTGTRVLPVILVSAYDSPEQRARGIAAGADAFLSKRDCVSGRLIDEVRQWVGRRRASA